MKNQIIACVIDIETVNKHTILLELISFSSVYDFVSFTVAQYYFQYFSESEKYVTKQMEDSHVAETDHQSQTAECQKRRF